VKPIYYETSREKYGVTLHIISPLSEKVGGRVLRVPHLIASMVVGKLRPAGQIRPASTAQFPMQQGFTLVNRLITQYVSQGTIAFISMW